MAGWLTERYLGICLIAQVMLSLLNSLFTLSDLNALIAMFGFYGLHQNAKNALLLHIIFSLVSICLDGVRLALWGDYITTNLLGRALISRALCYTNDIPLENYRTYYIVLLCFGAIIKLVCCIFSWVIYRDIVTVVQKAPRAKPK